jgi:hypothetical protein
MPIHLSSKFPVFLLLVAGVCSSQAIPRQQPAPVGPPPQRDISAAPTGDDAASERMAGVLQKRWNKERQTEIKKDTDKLLELAEELKAGVDKTNENVLALDVIKKAEEIERLAHSIRQKMKGPN